MKGKALLCIAMLLSVLVVFTTPASAGEPATVKIEFIKIDGEDIEGGRIPSLVGPPPDVCHEFTIAVVVKNVVPQEGVHGGVYGWVLGLSWTPGVISVALDEWDRPKIEEGPFLKDYPGVPPDMTSHIWADPEPGSLPDMACAYIERYEADGSGDMVYVTFHVDNIGSTDIDIFKADLTDYIGNVIPVVTVPGYFELPPPPAGPPKAIFTPEDEAYIYVCDDITLDASASTAAKDTVPEDQTCPIQNYTWEIDLDCDGEVDLTFEGEYIEDAFHCEAPGDVCINLTVYAPDVDWDPPGPPPPPKPWENTSPDFEPYDSEVHVIHQVLKPTGPAIDVYTENGGEMPGAPSDAFGPQEEVTVYAFVTYNEEPVENKLVAFEVKDPDGITRVTRTAATGANGIATTEFRIPWEGAGAEDMFGTWCIMGTVGIAETTVNDTCCFEFGYILSIRGITVTGSPLKKEHDLGVAVDIQNIASTSKNAFLAIVLYDECGVPIGMATSPITVDPEDGLTSVYTITIPGWAYVGTGKVYVNIFTGEIGGGGTPMCPEGEATFSILKTA